MHVVCSLLTCNVVWADLGDDAEEEARLERNIAQQLLSRRGPGSFAGAGRTLCIGDLSFRGAHVAFSGVARMSSVRRLRLHLLCSLLAHVPGSFGVR
jgi:hypothetical protein